MGWEDEEVRASSHRQPKRWFWPTGGSEVVVGEGFRLREERGDGGILMKDNLYISMLKSY